MKFFFMFIVFLSWAVFIYPQQHTLLLGPYQSRLVSKTFNESTNQAGYTQEAFNYGNWKDYIIDTKPAKYIYYNYHTAYQFSLTSIPSNAYNITAKIDAHITFGTDGAKIVSLPDNIFNGGNLADYWNAVNSGTFYFNVENKPGTFNDVTQLVLGKLQQGFINVGVRQSFSDYYRGKITIILKIEYDSPINITADNNFTAPNSTHGKIVVDGVQRDAPYLVTNVIIGTNITLQAVTPQTDNQGYQRIWHTGSVNQSEWQRDGAFKSNNQTYTFTVSTSDDNKTYKANLRKITNITFQNNFISVGNGGVIKVNGAQVSSPTASYPVVELNPITATAVSQGINNITYYFSNWSTGGTNSTKTFYPTSNSTITSNFVGIAAQSVYLNFDSSNPNLPITLHWNEYPNNNVTQYQVWRRVKYKKDTTGTPVLLATVPRGTTSYTDYDYRGTRLGFTDWMLWYDVRSYYAPEGTYPNPNWAQVFSDGPLIEAVKDKKEMLSVVKVNSLDNYPNPFNPSTIIKYQIVKAGHVTLKVYDMLGREVANLVDKEQPSGRYSVNFNASDLSSGIYLYRITANGFMAVKKMILLR